MGSAHIGNCIGCGGTLQNRVAVRLADAKLVACKACGSWNYFPRGDEIAQVELHDHPKYFDHPYFQNRRRQQGRAEARCRRIFAELAFANKNQATRGARVLDVGCGGGELLDSARRLFGVVPMGVDVSRTAIEQLKTKEIDHVHGVITDVPVDAHFDFIFAIDIIEHVSDPRSFLLNMSRKLAPGGVAYLETPNHRSAIYELGTLIANATGGKPKGTMERLFPPHHIVYLSHKALMDASAKSGMSLARLFTRHLPMLDIGVTWPLRIGLGGLQLIDQVTGHRALTCLVLTKGDI
jgi:2-polyprenyl-3-methyl-5-hydroxy-6-metoxy-1,4-benzoquinol methylase